MGRPRAYANASLKAQADYDAAVARNEAAWEIYDAAARNPVTAGDRSAWHAYCATLKPLDQAEAALSAGAEVPGLAGFGQLALFSVEEGNARAA
jgi:hypothetical protein